MTWPTPIDRATARALYKFGKGSLQCYERAVRLRREGLDPWKDEQIIAACSNLLVECAVQTNPTP